MLLPKPLQSIWGNLTIEELKKFGFLASIFFLVIGAYQMLKALKDPFFSFYVGVDWIPRAKIGSIIFVALAILFYSKLLNLFQKQYVFYIICSIYGLLFITFSYLLGHPDIIKTAGQLSWLHGNLIGWATYLIVESFGSILPALMWGFISSVTTTESAKRGYPMIVTFQQLGQISGPLLILLFGSTVALPRFWGLGGIMIIVVPFLITLFLKFIPQQESTSGTSVTSVKTTSKTSFTEGLRLLISKPYLMGIFVISTFFEFIGTILDFQKTKLIENVYPSQADGGIAFAWMKSIEGTTIGIVSLFIALLGTSFFLRKLGIRFSLLTFPIAIAIALSVTFTCFMLNIQGLYLMWIFVGSVIVIKGLSYSLNNPTREVLYIPTSPDVKFKTKGWIDAFGARSMKTISSLVTENLKAALPTLMVVGTILSLGVVGAWIFVAGLTFNKFTKLQEEKKVIE